MSIKISHDQFNQEINLKSDNHNTPKNKNKQTNKQTNKLFGCLKPQLAKNKFKLTLL